MAVNSLARGVMIYDSIVDWNRGPRGHLGPGKKECGPSGRVESYCNRQNRVRLSTFPQRYRFQETRAEAIGEGVVSARDGFRSETTFVRVVYRVRSGIFLSMKGGGGRKHQVVYKRPARGRGPQAIT